MVSFRRPVLLDEEVAEQIIGDPDPADAFDIAHATAQALVDEGRGRSQDRELVDRLVHLVEEEGLHTVAYLWSKSPAATLPGSLWRLYVIREWCRRDPHGVLIHFRAGIHAAEVSHAIVGLVDPPSPEDIESLADQILTGVFDGALDGAFDRASAFLRVVSTGMAYRSDESDDPRATMTRAAHLLRTADELRKSAHAVREGTLE